MSATDVVGNATTGGLDLTFDTAPPPAPQIVHAPSNPGGGSAQFDFTNAETGTVAQCQLDVGAWATCTAPVILNGLADGSHTFALRATDTAGNISTTTSTTWTVNNGMPDIAIGFPLAGRSYNNTTYTAGCNTPAADDICGTTFDSAGDLTGVAVSIKRVSTSLYWNGTGFTSAAEIFLPATGTTSWSYAMAATSFPADDSYTLTVRSDRVHDRWGRELDGNGDGSAGGDRTDHFFRLFGDADGDGDVDWLDRGAFRAAFNTTAHATGYRWYFDFDGDDDVDGRDNAEFNRRFGRS